MPGSITYLAASGNSMIIIPVKLDNFVMRDTALAVNAIQAITDALRMPTQNRPPTISMVALPERCSRPRRTPSS